MRAGIIYNSFLDSNGDERRVGGVETYIWYLSHLIAELGGDPILFQTAQTPFEKRVGPMLVIGVAPSRSFRSDFRRDLFTAAISRITYGKDILIFGADHDSVRAWNPKCISIQHGVSWDAPAHFFLKRLSKFLPVPMGWRKKWIALRAKRYFENCPNRVCVDYNFLNWYRTQVADRPEGNVWIIPNFADVPVDFEPQLPRPWTAPVKIIVARRFIELRGSRLMEESASRLLSRHAKLQITFAGEGPDLLRLRERFSNDSRVLFTRFLPQESVQVHAQHDIAVVPSLGSEGTSLAVAEAMAAGCAVIASNVGGVTNMVIDGFNGLLIPPEVEPLIQAAELLIADSGLRTRLGIRARETAGEAFSLPKWKAAWTKVLSIVERI